MQAKQAHESLKPLKFLLGKWQSISASGKFLDRIAPFNYCEQIEFTTLGQPMLNYNSHSWHPTNKNPMHLESGFLKIKPGSDRVSFLVSHNFGLTSVEEGNVVDNCIKLKSTQINRCSFNKEPGVVAIERCIELKENGQLEVKTSMATTATPEFTEHLVAVYNKVEG